MVCLCGRGALQPRRAQPFAAKTAGGQPRYRHIADGFGGDADGCGSGLIGIEKTCLKGFQTGFFCVNHIEINHQIGRLKPIQTVSLQGGAPATIQIVWQGESTQ